ncbi:hypothetical protein HF521_015890 [Silurus meridionalis]|uniref:Uncharacterized protein n=1 Tax=Silurus meridionalis TaxID=175797 RepID=A0A8T0A4V7_SILME|nr:hypothetical protein HF521_015890 [Silurus meridionalis]
MLSTKSQYRHMAANQHSSCMCIFTRVCQIEFSMSEQADIVKDFLGSSQVTSLDYIRKIVLRHQHSHLTLKNWEGNIFRVGTLKDTLYKDELDILEEWEQYYLPEHTSMQVIGVLGRFSYKSLNGELVLMVCEDGKVLKELFESGPQYPGIIQYYHGQCFEDMTDADLNNVKQSPKMIAQKKKNQDILESMENCYLRNLSIIMEKCQVEVLHSILFLGHIHVTCYSPENIFAKEEILRQTMEDFPGPFERYKNPCSSTDTFLLRPGTDHNMLRLDRCSCRDAEADFRFIKTL